MVNYGAVLVAAVAYFILGWVWYGPLFGKQWMKLQGMDPKKVDKSGMGGKLAAAFVANLVLAYVLAQYVLVGNIGNGLITGFWLWLGFVATFSLSSVLWEKKPFTLYLLNNAHNLLGILIMAAILVSWP
ncbi:TPA: DUF1761 domain-containing protein [Candidatus Woesearchaeota archaeon]|nr:hypothetical protein [archaeon]HIJ11979.1 DUF1761 domain-containing protein [Candidatus Woesearchaeota archaeon]|tara:strand:+ start:314 stop:700 length:387 start_codon:yes stop_codon:yes gene_type:complete